MSTTLLQLRTTCYNILKTDENSTAYPSSLMDTFINKAQRDICYWTVVDLKTKEVLRRPNLSFLNSDTFYSSVEDWNLTAIATVWGTTLSLDTTNFLSSWSVYIDWDVIAYTWKNATTLTWVTWIEFAHISWAVVRQLFALPTDFAKATRLTYNKRFPVRWIDFRDLQKELDNQIFSTDRVNTTSDVDSLSPIYTILDDFILVVWINTSGNALQFQYTKAPTSMSADWDTATIPDDWVKHSVPYFAVAEILYSRDEQDRAIELSYIAVQWVRWMYNYYSWRLTEDSFWNTVRNARMSNFINI